MNENEDKVAISEDISNTSIVQFYKKWWATSGTGEKNYTTTLRNQHMSGEMEMGRSVSFKLGP